MNCYIQGTDDDIDNCSRSNTRVDRTILFQDGLEGTPHTQATQHSGRTTTSASTTLRYGSKTFEEYMQQFMLSEVRYKDFRKASFQKFDSSQQDSFIHWYKLFCATCLQTQQHVLDVANYDTH